MVESYAHQYCNNLFRWILWCANGSRARAKQASPNEGGSRLSHPPNRKFQSLQILLLFHKSTIVAFGVVRMRVMVIGATGFIGRYVVARLVDAGHEVAVLHRGKTPLAAHKNVTEILGDRSTIRGLRNEFRTWSPDVAVDMILSSA